MLQKNILIMLDRCLIYDICNGAPIMITSDGIHDYLTVDQMEDIIDEFGLSKKACEEMITAARGNGSCDDISIVLGDV